MVKLNKELTLGVLLVVIVIMVLKPNILGFLYNNVLGKVIFVAAIVFLSLKHTAAGMLAVVFVAIVASMTGYHGFEGMTPNSEEETLEGNEDMSKDEKKNCEGDDCDSSENKVTEGADDLVKDVADINSKLKKK